MRSFGGTVAAEIGRAAAVTDDGVFKEYRFAVRAEQGGHVGDHPRRGGDVDVHGFGEIFRVDVVGRCQGGCMNSRVYPQVQPWLLYTYDAADALLCVALEGGGTM